MLLPSACAVQPYMRRTIVVRVAKSCRLLCPSSPLVLLLPTPCSTRQQPHNLKVGANVW
jgi:hypothetical protein